MTFLSDNRADLARIVTPTLVLQCRDDVIAPVEVGKFVHDAIAGSTSRAARRDWSLSEPVGP